MKVAVRDGSAPTTVSTSSGGRELKGDNKLPESADDRSTSSGGRELKELCVLHTRADEKVDLLGRS